MKRDLTVLNDQRPFLAPTGEVNRLQIRVCIPLRPEHGRDVAHYGDGRFPHRVTQPSIVPLCSLVQLLGKSLGALALNRITASAFVTHVISLFSCFLETCFTATANVSVACDAPTVMILQHG